MVADIFRPAVVVRELAQPLHLQYLEAAKHPTAVLRADQGSDYRSNGCDRDLHYPCITSFFNNFNNTCASSCPPIEPRRRAVFRCANCLWFRASAIACHDGCYPRGIPSVDLFSVPPTPVATHHRFLLERAGRCRPHELAQGGAEKEQTRRIDRVN
jgi:hypothetical protein